MFVALKGKEHSTLCLPSLCSVILVGQEPGTDFKEGMNIIRYKVYDQARNRAACKFIIRVEGKWSVCRWVTESLVILNPLLLS